MDSNASDILLLVIAIWLVIEIMNDGDWGGGLRMRSGGRVTIPVQWSA